MKTSRSILLVFSLAALGLGEACIPAHAAASVGLVTPVNRPAPAFQVTINVPPSMRPWRDETIADGFADRLATAFRQHGFQGAVNYVRTGEAASAGQPVLAINLVDWRLDRHTGVVDCTFSADWSTAQGGKEFGLFNGTSLTMGLRGDRLARADQFEDAARQAIDDLYRCVVSKKLIAPTGRV